MKTSCILCGLLLVVGLVASSPIVKRAAEDDLSPLNEVYVIDNEDEAGLDDERGDRDKRKIGVVKLGVTNGLINFVFGKLDAFLNAKTKALIVLDESNKAKNAAFGIDNTQSATTQFITNLIGQKIQAGTASIGPAINSATTFFSSAKTGLAGAFASKFAPLSSLSGGLTGGLAGGLSGGSGDSNGGGGSGNILSTLTSLSGSSGGDLSGGSSGINGNSHTDEVRSTTEEDIPEFDRKKVSLDVPPQAFGSGFTLITNVSKVLSNLIMNSALRTQSVLEVFKPIFRGTFAIKGLPSDNPK